MSKAVDVLAANDLVVDHRDGNTRLVQINSSQLSRLDDPFLQIPQGSFQTPVRTAVEDLRDTLDRIFGIVLYGSAARGEADRRSDIDQWVLVEEDRMANQRAANRVRQDLENVEFDTGRYVYEIDVEVLRQFQTTSTSFERSSATASLSMRRRNSTRFRAWSSTVISMSDASDPNAITEALDAAIDAFNEERYGVPTREAETDPDAD